MLRPSAGKWIIALISILTATLPLWSQYVPGQYTDEAPFRTWNSFPYIGAAALGRGQTAFAWGTDATVSPANPALLLTLPKWTFSVGGSFQTASAMKYGPLNSGVLESDTPLTDKLFSGDHAAISFHSGRFAVAAGIFFSESYNRPVAEVTEDSAGTRVYTIRYAQTGLLRTFHLAASFRLSSRLGAGFGLNVDSGTLDIDFTEDIPGWGYSISSLKSADLTGLYFNGGLFWEITGSVRAVLTFRTPSALEARTETVDRYQTTSAGTDIAINGRTDDSFDRPLVIGAGVTVQNGPRLRSAVEISYFRWSSYQAVWLGETQNRDFRDTLRISAGGEYFSEIRLFKKKAAVPVRIGFMYDPQPASDPRSAYFCFTFGTGLEIGGLRLDLGALLGTESGSGDKLAGRRLSLDIGYVF